MTTAAVGALTVAVVISAQDADDVFTSYLEDAADSPARLAGAVQVPFETAELRADAESRFRPANFEQNAERAGLHQLRKTFGESIPPFAVLGDGQLLYGWLDREPPFHTQLYDAGPRWEQEALVETLERRSPSRLLWRRDFRQDRVPYPVRTPLVFTHAVRSYIPEATSERFDLLRRRRPGQPLATAFWARRLGSRVNLRYVPSYSGLDDAAGCDGADGCAPVAEMRGEPDARGEELALEVSGRGHLFRVEMNAREGVETYPVRLDHLWFWPLVGDDPKVESGTPGWTAELERRRAGDALY